MFEVWLDWPCFRSNSWAVETSDVSHSAVAAAATATAATVATAATAATATTAIDPILIKSSLKKRKKNTFTSRFVQCHFQLVQKVQYCYQCVFRPAIHFPIHSEFPNMYLFGIITCVFASVVVVVYFMFILITFTIRFSELRYWSFTWWHLLASFTFFTFPNFMRFFSLLCNGI